MPQTSSSVRADHDLSSFGQRLKQQREQQGLSIEQVAQQLKMLPRMIEDIEAENYQALPELVFIKGYIRLYAQFLALSSQELETLFEAAYQAKQPSEANKLAPQVLQVLESHPSKATYYRLRRTNKWLPMLIKWLLVVLVIGAIVVGLWQSTLFRQNLPTTMVETAVNTNMVELPNVTSTRQTVDRLDLRFSAETKVRIADANGQELANATKQAGEVLSIQGQSPFAIELNPASAAEFRFNNNVIDLKPYTVNGAVNFRLSR